MRKFWKTITLLVSVLCLTLSLAVFAACDGGEDPEKKDPPEPTPPAKTTYTLTVKLPSGDPAVGYFAVICEVVDGEDQSCYPFGTTDANGVVSKEMDTKEYHIHLELGAHEGEYTFKPSDANGWYTVNGNSFTCELVAAAQNVNYTIEVSGPEDAPLENIVVTKGAGVTSAQEMLGRTDSEGKLVMNRAAITNEYAFISAPYGYTYDMNYTNSFYLFQSRGGTIRFKLLKQTTLTLGTEMDETAKNAFATAIDSSAFRELALPTSGLARAAYSFNAALTAGETQVFSFRAQKTGNYIVYAKMNDDTTLSAHGNSSALIAVDSMTGANSSMGVSMVCTRNQTTNFSVKAGNANESVQIVLLAPAETNEYTVTQTNVTMQGQIKQYLPADFLFRPQTEGTYRIEVLTQGVFTVRSYAENASVSKPVSDIANITTEWLMGTDSNWVFRVESDTYPVDIEVRITRIGNSTTSESENAETKEVETQLTQFADNTDSELALLPLGVYGTDSELVKDGDGNYHYGTVDGPLVLIKLSGPIRPYFDINFEELDFQAGRPYVCTVNGTLYNYAKFLRGYLTPVSVPGSRDPVAGTPEGEYYIKYTNSDGVYPLNDELKDFLQAFTVGQEDYFRFVLDFDNSPYSNESLWLFSAYYYGEAPEQIPAPSQGAGTQNSPYVVGVGEYSITFVGTSGLGGMMISETVYVNFTAPVAGTYTISMDEANVDILTAGISSLTNVTLSAGQTVSFTVESWQSPEASRPVTLLLTVASDQEIGGEGSKDAPVTVAPQSYQLSLSAGQTYYFKVSAGESYTITYNGNVKVYNIGGDVNNNEYFVDSRLVESGSAVKGENTVDDETIELDMYLAIRATEAVEITVTFA